MPSTTAVHTPSLSRRHASKQVVHKATVWSTAALRLALVVVVLLLGIWLRLAGLHTVSVRSTDENTYVMEANVLREHGTPGLQQMVQRFQTDPSLVYLPRPTRTIYLWLLDLSMRITGDSSSSAGVILSCIASAGSLFMVALIGWEFFSPGIALFATLFYAISPVERIFAQRTWQESLLEFVALSLLYIAARVARGARAWYWFAAFAMLGGLTVGLKEVSLASFLVCALWVMWSLYRTRDWKTMALFVSCSFLALGLSIAAIAAAVGGLRPLIESTRDNFRALNLNPYSREFEGGPPYRLLHLLVVISPVVFLFALPGLVLAGKKDHSDRGLVKQESIATWLAIFSLAFLFVAAFTPHRMNVRYICMTLGPLYLLSGLGFCWTAATLGDLLSGIERRLFIGFAVFVVVVGALIDMETFGQKLSVPMVSDLSAKMVLDAVDPIGPIHPMKSDTVPDEVEEAENLQAKEPSAQHLLSLAIEYDQVGRYEDSITTARKVLAIEPSSAEAYNTMSAASAGEKHWDAAIDAAKNALQFNPNYQLARNNLGWAEHEKQLALQGAPSK